MKKILIANRGEIAVRVIRTCRELGIETVAVFSDADRTSPHVLLASEAYAIGPAPSGESYLRQDKIVDVAQACGADAIHPGYGFLSENTNFAKAVVDAGMTWIGPPPEAVAIMGDKVSARAIAMEAGASVVPGSAEPVAGEKRAAEIATEIGYPILMKAVGGGGGKGMRVVASEKELKSALKTAQSEADAAFADDRVFIEKYLLGPRHIEIQIVADNHGNVVALQERECSVQRRYQKIIEESPSPFISMEQWLQMANYAKQIAENCGYVSAGTIEFLVDENHTVYFLEMNTRLQVEHPVTEMISGIDLVREQIAIAQGDQLT
ncbi:MAG: biotin carboxylase N-terminal domain-containing protein, partial [Candidatus Marinimicrobia bacterium]|nr:biotin carboxylase N-terminal domain-containing protein [Candidatus Neomarinimicrobiota bacterium]